MGRESYKRKEGEGRRGGGGDRGEMEGRREDKKVTRGEGRVKVDW